MIRNIHLIWKQQILMNYERMQACIPDPLRILRKKKKSVFTSNPTLHAGQVLNVFTDMDRSARACVRTCDVEIRRQLVAAFCRREPRRPEERLHLEGVGHDDAQERPMPPVHPPDGPRRALRDGGAGDHHDGGARHREDQQQRRDADESPARAGHDW